MALDFPTTPAINDLYTIGSRTYKWNGNAWDIVKSTSNVTLYPTITTSWAGAGYDSDGKFTGTPLKGDYALITVTWNQAVTDFTQAKILTPYETKVSNSNTITNFTNTNNTVFTFKFKPTNSPAQIKIAKNSVHTSDSTTLLYDVYSQALGSETKPYINTDVLGDGIIIKNVYDNNAQITRYYIQPVTYTNYGLYKGKVIYNFINFKQVPISLADAGIIASESAANTAYYFGGSSTTAAYNDITKSITYSHPDPSNKTLVNQVGTTNTNYGFYFPYGTGTANVFDLDSNTPATKTSKIRGVYFTPALNAYKYAGVAKIQVAENTYYDSGTPNIEGTPYYLGIFGSNSVFNFEAIFDKDGNTYSNVKFIKFKFTHYTALINTDDTKAVTLSNGTLSSISVDPSDPFGLTYIARYTPSSNVNVLDYKETITFPAGWKSLPIGFNGTTGSSLLSPEKTVTFDVKQSTIKYLNSSITSSNNLSYTDSVITFGVDKSVYAENLSNIIIKDDNNTVESLNNQSIIDNSNITTPVNINTITLNLTPSLYKKNTQYTVTIPQNFVNDFYGNQLDNLTLNSSIESRFKIDSFPITVTNSPVINGAQKPNITNTTPVLRVSIDKALANISTAAPLIYITEANSATKLLSWKYDSALKYGLVITKTATTKTVTTTATFSTPSSSNNNKTLDLSIYNTASKSNTYNLNRELRINKSYTLTVDLALCTDKFSNTGVAYTETFSIQPTDFIISTTDIPTVNASNETFTITFPRPVFKSTSILLPELYTDNNTNLITSSNTTISGYNTLATGTSTKAIIETVNALIPNKSHTLKIPAGMFEDYLGNPNKEYTVSFTTAGKDTTTGDFILNTVEPWKRLVVPDKKWTVPFNVTKVSAVLIGAGSSYNGGALIWINDIAVVPGTTYTLATNETATTLTAPNNVILIKAEAGSTVAPLSNSTITTTANTNNVPRATTSYDSSLESNNKGRNLGGLGILYKSGTTTFVDSALGVTRAGAGYYNAQGSDARVNSTPVSVGLYGINGTTGSFYGGSNYDYSYTPSGQDTTSHDLTPQSGAIRLMWGPGKSFPSNAA